MINSINQLISLFLDTFKFFGRGKAWLYLLCILAINWLLLYAHYNFTDPIFYSVVTWWTEIWNAQYAGGFTHYPGHFILLGYYFSYAKLFVGCLIEGGILGAVAVIFYRYIFQDSDSSKDSLKSILLQWMHLSLAWIIINGILTIGYNLIPIIFDSILIESPRMQMAFNYGVIPFFNILIVAILFFVIPYVAVYRASVLSGIKYSVLTFIKRPIFTLFLSSLILFVPILFSFIMLDPNFIIEKFKPSIIYLLLSSVLIVELFVNFFWIGTAVNFISDEE